MAELPHRRDAGDKDAGDRDGGNRRWLRDRGGRHDRAWVRNRGWVHNRGWARTTGETADTSEVRSAVLRFLAIGVITLGAVLIPVYLWIHGQAEQRALTEAILRTHQLADVTVGPLLDDAVRAGDASAISRVDAGLRPWMADGSLVRVKVWSGDGKILYSDSADLIGDTYPLPAWSPDLLAGGREHAWLGQPIGLDTVNEAAAGDLVEINVRATDAAGWPVIFEAYFDDEAVQNAQSRLMLDVLPVLVVSLVVLQLAQLLPAIGLARRIQAGQTSRRRLVQHAIVASDFERMRLARELHDEVIQDLAGLSYALEAEERQGTNERRALTGQARGILLRNLRTLRAITTELYPPDLERLGLNEALRRLLEHVAATGIDVHCELSPDVPSDKDRLAVLYRVAREALANVVKHSRASAVDLVLTGDAVTTSLSIRDNGRGFDPAAAAPGGHLGLRIMRDTVQMTDGSLSITSGVGEGTTVVVRIRRA
ncbi:sensor histidine kinase [Cryobacterium sp. 5B3]|uniref:sensor histidine kinase n=1 Tax=Cryobacterium sp. 5B3 TaxID=3048586 RepID=UPI002AB57C04|nr:sensor histidine kinase [Cryobacterium sp. 5B3]MDY7542389.1 sensor histidine kinase [Cryobacterium sp. 5B3]MEB0276541.1 sensor histidine kinase [Cryobacterium sp. 5B3]